MGPSSTWVLWLPQMGWVDCQGQGLSHSGHSPGNRDLARSVDGWPDPNLGKCGARRSCRREAKADEWGGAPLFPSGGHVPSSPRGKRPLLLRPRAAGVLQPWGFSTRCFQSLMSNLMGNHPQWLELGDVWGWQDSEFSILISATFANSPSLQFHLKHSCSVRIFHFKHSGPEEWTLRRPGCHSELCVILKMPSIRLYKVLLPRLSYY